MILVDTNIIIGFWRHPDENTAHIFATEDIAICGVVKAEILHGAHSLEDCKRILAALADFPCLEEFLEGTKRVPVKSDGQDSRSVAV